MTQVLVLLILFALSTLLLYGKDLPKAGKIAPLHFFLPETYVDVGNWGANPPIFECKVQLLETLETQGYEVKEKKNRWTRGTSFPKDFEITDQRKIQEILTRAECKDFKRKVGEHYFFFKHIGKKSGQWESFQPEWKLKIVFENGCSNMEAYTSLQLMNDPGSLLIARGEAAPSTKDVDVIPINPVMEEPSRLKKKKNKNVSGEMKPSKKPGRRKVNFSVIPNLGIHELYLNIVTEMFSDDDSKETYPVIGKIELWAQVNGKSKPTKIMTEEGHGHYGFTEAHIDKVIILDANGDGVPDFIIYGRNSGTNLFLMDRTRDQMKVKKKIPLIYLGPDANLPC